MFQHRNVIGFVVATAIVMAFSSSMALADHLDKHETGRIIRQVAERSDALQDRIESWVSDHHNNHHADELIRRADALTDAVTEFRSQLRTHDEPWDLRDQARDIVNAATELGKVIEHGEYHDDLRHEWDATHDAVDALAQHFHIDKVGR
jgi:hypothetical protein